MGSGRNSTKNLYFAQILPAISFPENFDILLEEMLANSGKAYPVHRTCPLYCVLGVCRAPS